MFAELGCHRNSCLAASEPDGGATPPADSSGCPLLSCCPAEGCAASWAPAGLLASPCWTDTTRAVLAVTGVGSVAGGRHQPTHRVLCGACEASTAIETLLPGKPCAVFAWRSELAPSLKPPWCPMGFPVVGRWLLGGNIPNSIPSFPVVASMHGGPQLAPDSMQPFSKQAVGRRNNGRRGFLGYGRLLYTCILPIE